MGIRMSGIISGLDTESVIKELMKAQSTKKTKIENKITKHEWKTEKWKELNTKILNLYTGTLSKARLQGSYMSKKAVSSDETKVTASASTSAVNGTHRVQVLNTASAQYVTSAKLGTVKNVQGEDVAVSGSTKLTQLGFVTDRDGNKETMINISSGDKMISLAVNDDTTVNDFLSACKGAGLNASYDTTQKRFFISAAESGEENSFTITTSTEIAGVAKDAVRNALGYDNLSATDKGKINVALNAYQNATTQEAKDAAMETLNSYVVAGTKSNLVQNLVGAYDKRASLTDQEKKDIYYTDDLQKKMETAADEAEDKYLKSLSDGETPNAEARKKAIDDAVLKVANEYASDLQKKYEAGETTDNPYYKAKNSLGSLVDAYVDSVKNSSDNTPLETNALAHLGLQEITDGTATVSENGFSLVGASDAVILYNGAELTSSTSSISVNGITINANAKTEGEVSVTVSNDNSAVYDMVKEFIKEYNEVLGLMNDSYNAASARDYEVLTDEEREAMTDEQIEKWENKIKDSLLRRDSTLGSLLSSMKMAMQTSVTYNGRSYSLASFGICTTDYTEYGKLHIYGDEDDSTVSGKKDKLMAAIESDPDAVMNVLSGIAGKLYDSLQEQMKSTTLSSSMTLYNDKQMSKDLTNYKDELKKMETYLKDLEDRYYKQFTAMETAMAKLNSQSNSLASLMGMSTQQQ